MPIEEKDILKMNRESLEGYILSRLSGLSHDPPYFPERGLEPEQIILRTFEVGKSTFQRNFDRTVARLLSKVEINNANGFIISRLFYLIERLNLKEVEPVIKDLWNKREMFQGINSYYTDPDLFVHLLSVRAMFQKGDELLKDVIPLLENKGYAPAAYTAIMRINLELAVDYLTSFGKIAHENNKEIWIERALELLAEYYGNGSNSNGALRVYKQWSYDCLRRRDQIWLLVEQTMSQIPVYRSAMEAEEKRFFKAKRSSRPVIPLTWQPVET